MRMLNFGLGAAQGLLVNIPSKARHRSKARAIPTGSILSLTTRPTARPKTRQSSARRHRGATGGRNGRPQTRPTRALRPTRLPRVLYGPSTHRRSPQSSAGRRKPQARSRRCWPTISRQAARARQTRWSTRSAWVRRRCQRSSMQWKPTRTFTTSASIRTWRTRWERHSQRWRHAVTPHGLRWTAPSPRLRHGWTRCMQRRPRAMRAVSSACWLRMTSARSTCSAPRTTLHATPTARVCSRRWSRCTMKPAGPCPSSSPTTGGRTSVRTTRTRGRRRS